MALVPHDKKRLTLPEKAPTYIPTEVHANVSALLRSCLDPSPSTSRALVPNVVRFKGKLHRLAHGRGVGALPQLSLQHHYETLRENPSDRLTAEMRVKSILAEWVASYNEELTSHEAITVGVQVVLSQIRSTTEFLGSPNVLRAAVVFMLMDKVTATMGRYKPVMCQLMDEMKGMVYIAKTSQPFPTCMPEYMNATSYFEQYMHLMAQHVEFERLSGIVHRTLQNKMLVMDRAVKHWQMMLVLRVFSAWHNTVKRSIFRQCAMKDFIRRANRKDVLQSTFYAWRLLCANLKVDVERSQLIENMDTILQKEAVTSTRLAETEDKLDESRTKLFNLKEEVGSLRDNNTHLLAVVNSQEFRVSQWRTVSSAYVQYVLRLSEAITQIQKPDDELGIKNVYNVVEQTLLGWILATLTEHDLQRAMKRQVQNFTTDLKDCAAYILLLHCLTKGQMSLQHLEHNDFQRRAEAVIAMVTTLGVECGITSDDLVCSIPDYHIVFLHTLWSHCYIPPPLVQFEVSAMQGIATADARNAFVDDVREFNRKLMEVKTTHQEWLALRNILSRYVHTLLLNRSRGLPIKIVTKQDELAAAADLRVFTTLPMAKLMEAFQLLPHKDPAIEAATNEENSAELMNAQSILMRYFTHTRRVYQYYAIIGVTRPRGLAMDVVQFHRFCLDCKIIGQGFSKKECVMMFQETNERNGDLGMDAREQIVDHQTLSVIKKEKGAAPQSPRLMLPLDEKSFTVEDLHNPDNMLIPNEFVQLLCRVAIKKFCPEPLQMNATSPLSLGDALNNLYVKHIIPKACVADSSEFKQEIFSELVQSVLKKTRRNTMKIFKHFGSGHDSAAGMTCEEFGTMIKDANLLDSSLNARAVMEIFSQFQESQLMMENVTAAMVYSEFEEALVCLAVFKSPAPYVPLHIKVSSFIEGLLIPELSKVIKFK